MAGAVILTESLTTNKPDDFTILALSSFKKPLVSVIVPVYNQERTGFLVPCVDSLVNQSLKNIEIICVDDASTDHSLEVLQQYATTYSNITVIAMTKNSRQGTARNRGIEVAKGDYISFVDSDDCLEIDFYEKMYQVAKENDCDAVESSFQYINEQGIPSDEISTPHGESQNSINLNNNNIDYFILNHGMIWSYLFKTEIITKNKIRFPERTRFEDTPTFIEIISKLNRMGFCPEAKYFYRLNSASTNATTPNDMEALSNRIKTADLIIDSSKKSGFYYEHKEALDFYYLKVAVINTLYAISKSSLNFNKRELKKISEHAKCKIAYSTNNQYIKCLPFYQKIATLLAINSPTLYCRLRKLLEFGRS